MRSKKRGHYCNGCGDFLPNEKFSGRGHREHLCKECKKVCILISPESTSDYDRNYNRLSKAIRNCMLVYMEYGSFFLFVEAVLKDWISKGYQTVKEILDAQLAFKVQKQKKTIAKPVRIEVIPEWLDKDKQPESPVFELDFATKKRLFEERLKIHC